MKITSSGVVFERYTSASPGTLTSSFKDVDGACLTIDTATLICMYEICKYDLVRKGMWETVLERLKTENPL